MNVDWKWLIIGIVLAMFVWPILSARVTRRPSAAANA